MPLGPAQATPPTEFPVGDAHNSVVTDGALFYLSSRNGLGTIRRLRLDSGQNSTVFTAPNRRTHVSDVDAGGGRRLRAPGLREHGQASRRLAIG
jgi:hypothetical protein